MVRQQTACDHRFSDRLRVRGFTFVELLVVLVIIVLLLSLGLPAMSRSRQRARILDCSNNLRNINLALIQAATDKERLPACGNFGKTTMCHSWVLGLLPHLDQGVVYVNWNQDAGLSYPPNQTRAQTSIRVLTCPSDLSVEPDAGNLSYVVNGGIGFTAQIGGVHDCPVAPFGSKIDFNGNGSTCLSSGLPDGDPSDKDFFFKTGLFFNETWKWNVTVRHHRLDTVVDGLSQTITLAENVRTGYNPSDPNTENWANSNPYRTSFYIGNPCKNDACTAGNVDYGTCNSGKYAINSGLTASEGASPVPNSFHGEGVNMAFGDGRVKFVNQKLDSRVYAALVSPQGMLLENTLLAQPVVSDASY